MSCESTLQRPFKTGDRVSPGGLKTRVGNGKSNENPSDHRRGATGGDDGVQCQTGVSHAGTRPWPRHHGARSASRAGTLGLRPLGLPLAPELLGSAALLGLAQTILGRRLWLSPPLVVIA